MKFKIISGLKLNDFALIIKFDNGLFANGLLTLIWTERKYLSTNASNYFRTGTLIRPKAGLTANNVVANPIIGVKVDQTVAWFFPLRLRV